MNTGFMIGAVIFAIAFLLGGVASYRIIRDTKGPLERNYVLWMCAGSWLLVLSLLGWVILFTGSTKLYYIAGGYFVLTPVLFYRWSVRHQLIRELERRRMDAEAPNGA